MWKTVSARLRSSKAELEEMGESTEDLVDGFSKYRKEIMALSGFDIMKNEREFKTPMQIFVGLAEVWDKLESDTARSRIAEILGGTRNLSGIASTIQNINDAIGAYEVAMDSAGVSEKANAKYMETTEAHIGQLKASFQELSSDVFNSETMKAFVDGGKAVVDTIDFMVDSFGALPTAFGLLSGGILAVTALKSNFIPFLTSIGEGITGIGEAISANGGVAAGLTAISGLSAGALAGIAAVAVTIPFAIKGYQMYQQHLEELRIASQKSSKAYLEQADSYEDSYRKVAELRGKIDSGTLSSSEEYEARSQLLDIQNQMIDSYGAQAAGLDLVNGKLDEQQAKMRELNVQAAKQLLDYDIDKNTLSKATEVMEGMYGGKYGKHLAAQTFTAKDLADSTKNAAKEQKVLEKLADDYKDVVQLTKQVDEETNSTSFLFKYTGKTKDARENLEGFMTDLRSARNEIDGATPHLDAIFEGTQKAVSEADNLLSEYQDIYEAAKKAELVSDDKMYADDKGGNKNAYDWLNDYADAVTKYNNALESGDKEERLEAANSFRDMQDSISGLTGSGGGLEQYKDQFDKVGNTLNKAAAQQEEFEEVLSGDYVSDATKDVKLYGDALKGLKLTDADFMNAFMSKGGDNWGTIGSFIDAAKRAGYISSDSKEGVEALANSLVNAGYLADTGVTGLLSYTSSVETLKTMMSDYASFNKDLQSAFDNSKSATGLLVEDIDKLSEAYKGLESYNPAKLFEHTYDGIHLNNEELQKLNKELSDSKLKALNDSLWERQNALLNGAGDKDEIQGQITDIKNLMSMYEGLNSAYSQYLNAKAGKNERDSYSTIGSDYASMKATLDQGWYGDDALNAYVDLLAGAGKGVDDVAERFASLGEKIEGTNHSLMDYIKYIDEEGNITTPLSEGGPKGSLSSDGLVDFVEDVRSVFGDEYASVMDDGTYKLDLMGDKLGEVAEKFHTTPEFIQLMERAMIDAGMAMVLDSNNLEAMTAQLENVQENFEGLKDIDFSFDITKMSADELASKRQELENAKATIDVDTEGADEALQVIDSLISAIEGQEYQLKIKAQVDQSEHSVDELLNADDETIKRTFQVEGDDEIQRVRDTLQEISSGESTAITVKLDDSQFSQLTGAEPIEVPVEYKVEDLPQTTIDPIEVPVNYVPGDLPSVNVDPVEVPVNYVPGELPPSPEAQSEDVNVNYVVNADPQPIYQNMERRTHYAVIADPVPDYPNLSRTVTYTIVTVGSPPSGGSQATGTMTSIGVAHANGTAYNAPWNWLSAFANGKISLPKNEIALVNELGTESIIFICDIIQ